MTKHQDQELARLESILKRWRATKETGGSRSIPAEVWTGAVNLAQQLTVGQVARRLHIDHGKLKRLTEKAGETKLTCSASTTFLEFQPTQFTATHSPLSCALEVESAGGGVLRARLDGASPSDLGTVLRAFGA